MDIALGISDSNGNVDFNPNHNSGIIHVWGPSRNTEGGEGLIE